MRKITKSDIEKIIGTSICGYYIENARVKSGECCNSDNYGILLGKNDRGVYVTWQFHFNGNEISVYWGHYTEKHEIALKDFYSRDTDTKPDTYRVTITETSKMNVFVEANCREDAEQIAFEKWNGSEYVLDSENFCNVEFTAVEADEVKFDES